MATQKARADSLSLLLFTLRSGKLMAINLLKVSEIIPCPPLTKPTDGTAGAVLTWSVETARAYNRCAARHRALVDAWPK